MVPVVSRKVIEDFVKNVFKKDKRIDEYIKQYYLEIIDKQPLLGAWFTEWLKTYLIQLPPESRFAALQAFVIPLKLIYMQDELEKFNKLVGD